jgi:hypothetical protein
MQNILQKNKNVVVVIKDDRSSLNVGFINIKFTNSWVERLLKSQANFSATCSFVLSCL